MRKKAAYFYLTMLIACAVFFLARQRTLNNLRAESARLQHQVEARNDARLADIPQSQATPVAQLSEAEERELLQLRAKIGPLRENLREASNRLALLQRLPASR
jgi:C4-dicarboxylate-specific signal transduction histidine kinase